MNYKRLLFNWLAKKGILHLYKRNLLYYRSIPPPLYNKDNILLAITDSFSWMLAPESPEFWIKCHKDWVEFYENYKLKYHEPKNK